MGYAMASNIRKKLPADSILYINDVNAAACERFKAEYSSHGPIEIISTAREAAQNSKVVISIVPGAADVKQVYLDEKNGVIAATPDEQRVMCECSTIDVKSTREVGEALKAKGMGTYVDTPVSVRTFSLLTGTTTKTSHRAASQPQNAVI
jgi:3-hydroxyisobutyrate dehydrogenase